MIYSFRVQYITYIAFARSPYWLIAEQYFTIKQTDSWKYHRTKAFSYASVNNSVTLLSCNFNGVCHLTVCGQDLKTLHVEVMETINFSHFSHEHVCYMGYFEGLMLVWWKLLLMLTGRTRQNNNNNTWNCLLFFSQVYLCSDNKHIWCLNIIQNYNFVMYTSFNVINYHQWFMKTLLLDLFPI